MRQRVLAIGFLLLGLWPAVAGAGAAGVDLIFLLDQSGSMMGQGATRISNDPNGKRFDALRALEGRLAESAGAGMTNRISVIEFGGRHAKEPAHRPQVTLSRYEIPPLPPGGDPRTVQRRIHDGLTQVRPAFRGDTDHAEALRLATLEAQYFRDHPPAVLPGGQAGARQQVVVLMTDGASYYAKDVPAATLKTEVEAQIHKLEQMSQVLTFLVFGFNDASDYWNQGWGDFWDHLTTKDPQTQAGRAYRLLSDDQAVDKVVELVSGIIPPVTAVSPAGERYVAPAYLRALDFTINFKTPGVPLSAIDIRDPDGHPISVTAGTGGVASATAPYPQPGVWQFPASPHYTVIPIPRYETATLVEPLGPVGKDSAVRIRYQLNGRGTGGLLQAQSGLPTVQFQLTLVSPSGQTQTIAVQEDGAGHVSSQADVPLPESGTYTLDFKGTTLAVDGNPYTVYQSSQAGGNTITVNATIPLVLRLEEPRPQNGATISLFNGAAEVPVRLRFYNPKTNVLLEPQAVLKPGAVLTVAAQAEGKSEPPGTAAKAQLQVADQGLAAVLPLDYGGARWGDYLGGNATIRLQLSPDNFWQPDYQFLGIDGDSRRYLLSPPLKVRESWWSLWPVPLLLLLLAGLWLAWGRFGHPWLLALRDESMGQNPKLVFKVIKNSNLNKTWPLKGTGTVTEPNRVELDPAMGDTWAIQKFKISRLRGSGKEVAIWLTYKPRKPEKAKTVKVKLFTRDDSGQHSARHRVEGLEGDQEAAFVLFAGNKKP